MKKQAYRNYIVLCIILSCILTFGCAHQPQTPEQIGYKTLSTAAEVYETTMSAMGDLYKQGKLSESDKDKVIDVAKIYWSTYHSATLAMDVWMRTKNADDKIVLDKAITELTAAIPKFQEFVLPLFQKSKDK